jgi:hypothetical protein
MRTAALAAAATLLVTGAAPAGPANISRPQLSASDGRIVQVHVRHHYHHGGSAFPLAIIGGIVGGALNNGCYYNDCGYGYGGYGGGYGGGGYRGGGRGGHGGGGGWGGHGGHGGGGHGGGHGGGGHGGHP